MASENIEDLYRGLVRDIGPGFHPDTLGLEYDSLPSGWTAQDVDDVIDMAMAEQIDVYGIALDIIHEMAP